MLLCDSHRATAPGSLVRPPGQLRPAPAPGGPPAPPGESWPARPARSPGYLRPMLAYLSYRYSSQNGDATRAAAAGGVKPSSGPWSGPRGTETPMHLAVALDGAGWHPAAWREPRARPAELFTARYWTDLVAEAERGLLDFVTIEDGFGLQSSRHRTDRGRPVRGRLDAVLIAARVAPLTAQHRAGADRHRHPHRAVPPLQGHRHARLRQQRAGPASGSRSRRSPDEAAHFGRRARPATRCRRRTPSCSAEAADYVEVVRRLWDSWEDDAEIRDAATGRFIDRDKLHYIDFAGEQFSVKGPSITPRPPQGQPLVAALGARRAGPYRLVAGRADVGFVTPHDAAQAARDRRRDPRRAGRAGRADDRARLRRPGGLPRRRPPRRGRQPQGPARRAGRPRRTPATRPIFTGTPARAGRPAAGLAAARAVRASGCGPARPARRPRRRSPDALVPELQRARRVPRRATRPARCAALLGLRPPGQPLRAA